MQAEQMCYSNSSSSAGLSGGIKSLAESAFSQLQSIFSKLVFDLRLTNFHDMQSSFIQVKLQIESILNSDLAADLRRLVREFNRLANIPVCSSDDNSFEVIARLSRHGRIELMFLEP